MYTYFNNVLGLWTYLFILPITLYLFCSYVLRYFVLCTFRSSSAVKFVVKTMFICAC